MASSPTADSLAHEDDDDVLITGEAVALDLRPTPFVLRAAGLILDWLVYLGGAVVILVALFSSGILGNDQAVQSAAAIATLVTMIVIVPLVVELLSHGKSLGRLAAGARIVRDDGGAIGFRQAFIRSLVGVIEIYFTFGGLAALVALLNSRSKRLGDLLAGTYSQYERTPKEVLPLYAVPEELREWSLTADVARMPDRVGRRMSQFLRSAPGLSPAARGRLARELAIEASAWVYPVPHGADAELFVAAVVTLRRDRELRGLTLERERLTTVDAALRGIPHGFPDRP